MSRALSCRNWWAIPLLCLFVLQPACTKSPDAPQEQPAPKGFKWVLAKGRQPAAVAVVVHGLGAPKSMDQVVWQLTEGWQAADVLQVTLAGHEGGPESSPDKQEKIWRKQLQEAYEQAKQRAGNRLELWFLGHSLGVALCADILRQENMRFHRMVWFAAVVSLSHLIDSLAYVVNLLKLKNEQNDIKKLDRFLGYVFLKGTGEKMVDYKKIFGKDINKEKLEELGKILRGKKHEKGSILQWESIKNIFSADLHADLEPIFTLKPSSLQYEKLGQTTRVGLQAMETVSDAVATNQKDALLNRFPTLILVDPDDLVVSKVGIAQQKQANAFTNWRLVSAPATGHGKVTHIRDQAAVRETVKEFLGLQKVLDAQVEGDNSSDNRGTQ